MKELDEDSPATREQVRAVMRYAGPRMIGEHPLLAVARLAARRQRVGAAE